MSEIISDDNSVLFFQNPERGLIKLRKYGGGVDLTQIEIMCQNINFSVGKFITLCETHLSSG